MFNQLTFAPSTLPLHHSTHPIPLDGTQTHNPRLRNPVPYLLDHWDWRYLGWTLGPLSYISINPFLLLIHIIPANLAGRIWSDRQYLGMSAYKVTPKRTPSDPITLLWKDRIISAMNSLIWLKLEGPTDHDSSTKNTMSAGKAVRHSEREQTKPSVDKLDTGYYEFKSDLLSSHLHREKKKGWKRVPSNPQRKTQNNSQDGMGYKTMHCLL